MGAGIDPLSDAAFSSVARASSYEEDDVPLNDTESPKGMQRMSHSPLEDTSYNTTSVNTVASYGQLLGAPSFSEDATLFEKMEIQPDAHKGTNGNAHKPTNPPAILRIAVDDPVKKIESSIIPGVSGGHMTYRITTTTTLESFAKPQTIVRRRFRDVVALADLLKSTQRGYFIPPRPEKNAVEGQRSTEEFVEQRRTAIQKYLMQLAAHPVIGRSQELQVFLEAEGPLENSLDWQQLQPLQGTFLEGAVRLPKQLIGQDRTIPSPAEVATRTKASGDLFRRFKELRQSVKNEHVQAPRLDQEEISLRDETRQVEEFQERLAEASRKAEKLVAKMDEAGNTLGLLGLSLIKLSKFEDEEGAALGNYTASGAATKSISADSKRVGTAAVRLSRLSEAANEQTVIALEPLHSNLALCPAVLKALKEREGQLLTLQSIEEDMAKKRKALDILEEQGQRTLGNELAQGRKVGAIQNDMAALEAAQDAAKSELRRITSRNQEELTRWQKERSTDFTSMQDTFLRVETAFQERNLSVWLAVAEEFNAAKGGRVT